MEQKEKDTIKYADDDNLSVKRLAWLRAPSLLFGLVLGIFLCFTVSRFEEVLAKDVRIAFFIPFIVYMASAVATQTENIYARDLRTGRASFKKYLLKETFLGLIFGAGASLLAAAATSLWIGVKEITLAVSLSMFCAICIAPLVALVVTEILQLEHRDPAVGSGPIATVIQDTLSIVIYGLIASAIVL